MVGKSSLIDHNIWNTLFSTQGVYLCFNVHYFLHCTHTVCLLDYGIWQQIDYFWHTHMRMSFIRNQFFIISFIKPCLASCVSIWNSSRHIHYFFAFWCIAFQIKWTLIIHRQLIWIPSKNPKEIRGNIWLCWCRTSKK